jgi:hypothetical protein
LSSFFLDSALRPASRSVCRHVRLLVGNDSRGILRYLPIRGLRFRP